jgi:polysaccharide biosynthesis/export protein
MRALSRMPGRSRGESAARRKAVARLRCAALLALLGSVSPAWSAFTIQQGDTIEISVAGIPELKQRSTVQPDGAIALPLVGALAVEGLTPSELRTKVQTQLGKKIYRLRANDGREILTVIQPEEVSAAIVAYRPIYVTGDVAKPGEQTFLPEMTVRQALALAGGVDSQNTQPKASRDFPALRRDYDLALSDLASASARIARVTAELDGQTELGAIDFSDAPLPRERLADIEKSEAAILQARMTDYGRERNFLKAALDQSDERISIVAKRASEEEEGSRADNTDLRRLLDLLSKGQETNPRITEARRALLLSSTRALQANVELLELKRQKSEGARKAEHFDDERRIGLLKDLQEAAVAKAAAKIKTQALAVELNASSRLTSQAEPVKPQHSIEVVRQGKDRSTLTVDEDFVLMPGDVIDVALRTPGLSVSSDP